MGHSLANEKARLAPITEPGIKERRCNMAKYSMVNTCFHLSDWRDGILSLNNLFAVFGLGLKRFFGLGLVLRLWIVLVFLVRERISICDFRWNLLNLFHWTSCQFGSWKQVPYRVCRNLVPRVRIRWPSGGHVLSIDADRHRSTV